MAIADGAYWVLCIDNQSYSASLERGKIYRAYHDHEAEADQLIRVIDESGEDYLYSAKRFEPIVVPRRVEHALTGRAVRGSRVGRTTDKTAVKSVAIERIAQLFRKASPSGARKPRAIRIP